MLRLLLLLICATSVAASSAAQEPARRNQDRGRLILPDQPPAPAPEPEVEQQPAPERPSFWGKTSNRYEARFAQFEELEQPTEEQFKTALSDLRGLGLGSRETALRALDSPYTNTVLLAARLLELVGEPEDAVRLVEVASGVGVSEIVSSCLETSLRLNGGRLPARAVRLVEHPRKSVRGAAEARLERAPHDEHLVPLLQIVRFGRDSDARQRSARLLGGHADNDDVRAALRAALVDPSVPVAMTAAESLIGESGDEDVGYFREQILETAPGPELAYLVWGLLLQQQDNDLALVDEELEPKLVSALQEPDIFLSGAAAACLAEFGFRSEREGGFKYLNREVPHALVRAVGGVTFYPQYSRLLPLAEASLRRITGVTMDGENPSAWLEWLVANIDDFRAVRGALVIGPTDHTRVQVAWRTAGSPKRWLGGPEHPVEIEGIRLLGKRGLEQLVDELVEARLLDLPLLPGVHGDPADPLQLEIEVHVGQRRKWIAFRSAHPQTWMSDLAALLNHLHSITAWQMLSPPDQRRAFTIANLPRWDSTSPQEQVAFLKDLMIGRLGTMSSDALRDWSAFVARSPGMREQWDETVAMEFISELANRGDDVDLSITLLEAALVVPEPSLTAPMLDVISTLAEPARSELLQAGLRIQGQSVCQMVLSDPRLAVRVASARALAGFGPEAVPALVSALRDSNALVQRVAARSLGRIGDAGGLSALLPLAGKDRPEEVRREALWALGAIGHNGAFEAVYTGARDALPGVRIAAILALGSIPGDEVDLAFRQLFPAYAAGPLEAPFLRSLEGRGAHAARAAMRPYLDSPDEPVARRAAINLGALGDPIAAPVLIDMLSFLPRDEEVLDGLCYTLCSDFRRLEDPAGMYTEWWRERGREQPSQWLSSSLAAVGLPVPEELNEPLPSLGEDGRRRLVIALLDLIDRGPAYLRPALTYHLQRLTGIDAPAMRAQTPESVARKIVDGWKRWLEAGPQG